MFLKWQFLELPSGNIKGRLNHDMWQG